jgi:hypothetical protein
VRANNVRCMAIGAFSILIPARVVRAALRCNSTLSHHTRGGSGLHSSRQFRRRGSSFFIPNEPWSYSKKEKEEFGKTFEKVTTVRPSAAAAMSRGSAASIEEVSERLVRYWDAECGEGRRSPEPLAPRQASVLVPLVSSAAAAAAEAAEAAAAGEAPSSSDNDGDSGYKGSAVHNDGGVHVLLCTRAATLSSHAGEVCLPAGNRGPRGGEGLSNE